MSPEKFREVPETGPSSEKAQLPKMYGVFYESFVVRVIVLIYQNFPAFSLTLSGIMYINTELQE